MPLMDDGPAVMDVVRSPAFDRDVLVLVASEVEEGEPLAESPNRELHEELGRHAASCPASWGGDWWLWRDSSGCDPMVNCKMRRTLLACVSLGTS